jgi:hypothetical protein
MPATTFLVWNYGSGNKLRLVVAQLSTAVSSVNHGRQCPNRRRPSPSGAVHAVAATSEAEWGAAVDGGASRDGARHDAG